MKRKIIITLMSIVIGCTITNAQILNSYSHSKIIQKEEIPFKYFFYGAVEGGYWRNTGYHSNGVFGALVGFKHCIKSTNFFAGALLDIEKYIEGECSFCAFIEPTLSYIKKIGSITDRTIDLTIGYGIGYYEHGVMVPDLNLTYWFSRIGIGGTARFIIPLTPHTTANYNLMARIAIRF